MLSAEQREFLNANFPGADQKKIEELFLVTASDEEKRELLVQDLVTIANRMRHGSEKADSKPDPMTEEEKAIQNVVASANQRRMK